MNGSNAYLRLFWQYYVIYLPFVFALGAVVGSFLNVVIFRLPEGRNIISPPSHCPVCETRLRWHENLPIVGWLRLRGRCAHCGTGISMQYPAIEALCGLAFIALFVLCYLVRPSAPFFGGLAPAYFATNDIRETWPLLTLHYILLSSLLAMTVIDLRTYTIPIELTWAVAVPAFLVHAIMPLWPGGSLRLPLTHLPPGTAGIDLGYWTIPLVGPAGLGAALGGMAGVAVGTLLLRQNSLRPSFLDFDLYVGAEDSIIDYPHPRREIEWELDFLGPVILGLLAGWWIGGALGAGQAPPLWAASLGGSLTGYLVGAGLIWTFRVLGTLAFGKEALGLGDAHLLAAIGGEAPRGGVESIPCQLVPRESTGPVRT